MKNLARRFILAGAIASAILWSPQAVFANSDDLTSQLPDAIGEYRYYKSPAHLAVIEDLLKRGASPSGTPMMLAVYYKIADVVDLFLKEKIDIDEPISDNGETILLFALNNIEKPTASETDVRMIRSLVKAGADLNLAGRGGIATPLILAASGGRNQIPQPALVKLLLEAGADARQTTHSGFSPLISEGATNLEVIQLLVGAGADPYVVSSVGSTPLHYVCKRDFDSKGKPDPQAGQRIALLLRPGAFIDAFYPQKRPFPVGTPLLSAAISDNPDCVRALFAAGAQKTAPAFPPSYVATDPAMAGVTVQQKVLSSAKKSPILYSPEVVELFK